MKSLNCIKYTLLSTILLVSFPSDGFEKDVRTQYKNKIKDLSEQCSKEMATTAPQTIEELFCSPSPINNIAARYCLHEKMINNNTMGSIKSYHSSEKDKDTKSLITVTIQCDSIEY